MDYKNCAQQIYELIGGRNNLISGAHCATRLRLVVVDDKQCEKEAIENLEGIKGVFTASGQLQIILGTGMVNKVYDEFVKIAGIADSTKEEVKLAAAARQNWLQRGIRVLGDIFVPIIPAIVASGLLMGVLEGLLKIFPTMTNSGTYIIIHLFSNAAFVFLPVLIAISAAKAFGGNPYLGAVIGMIMIHPDLLNAWSVATAETIPTASAWFGLYHINLTGYQGHVIPVVIAVWFMCIIEKRLHKIVPEILDLFITPLVTVLLTGYCTLTIFGPIFSGLENMVLSGIQYLISIPYGIGAFLSGAIYAPTVVSGVHHMYNALEAGLLSATGVNIWMPIATAANVAQGGAALALGLKAKNKKIKALALPASLSAFMGITEPAIFGVNLRYVKPFVAGIVGGAIGALFASAMGIAATAYGITGIFGVLITTDYIWQYLLLMLISAGIAFILSWFMYREDDIQGQATQEDCEKMVNVEQKMIFSPLGGRVIPLEEVSDETFANQVLGKGIAIIPTEGTLVAPCDGIIEMVYDTKHAIGMTTKTGVELLLHVGINTVELGGCYFESHVTNGKVVRQGDVLLTFDMQAIVDAGYQLTTPIIVTNSDDYESIEVLSKDQVEALENLIVVK